MSVETERRANAEGIIRYFPIHSSRKVSAYDKSSTISGSIKLQKNIFTNIMYIYILHIYPLFSWLFLFPRWFPFRIAALFFAIGEIKSRTRDSWDKNKNDKA